MQEAQAAASLNHPNIVTAYDIDNENGIYYFVITGKDGVLTKKVIIAR